MVKQPVRDIIVAAVISSFVIAPIAARADLLNRGKIAEWGDPLTPPQSRTSCISYASGDWPWPAHGGWKTCNGWKTEWRHMEVEMFFEVDGPGDLVGEAKNAVNQCALVASAAAIGAGIATSGSSALAAGKVAFEVCIGTKASDLAGKFSFSVPTQSHWTDWS